MTDSMNTQPLAPCPFCGMPGRLVFNDGFCWCECINHRDCGAVQPVCNHADVAVSTWNRRAVDTERATLLARVAELEAQLAEAAKRWEPVADGTIYHHTEKVKGDFMWPEHIESIEFLAVRNNGTEIACGSMPIEDEHTACLDDDVRLCRKVSGETDNE